MTFGKEKRRRDERKIQFVLELFKFRLFSLLSVAYFGAVLFDILL